MGRESLRVAVLASWRADGLDGLFESDGRWEVVVGVVTEPGSHAVRFLDSHRVPRMLRDLRGFCLRRGVPLSDPDTRRAFDSETAARLLTFRSDLIVLCGYCYWLSEPFLACWPDRIINIHDADLRVRRDDGSPRYRGLRAVRDAVSAGEPETRSTVHLVTPEIDAGPPLVVSGPYPVSLPADVRTSGDGIGTYAAVHRERMIRECWGPLLRAAVELFSEGQVAVMANGRVLIDGHPAPLVLSPGVAPVTDLQEVA